MARDTLDEYIIAKLKTEYPITYDSLKSGYVSLWMEKEKTMTNKPIDWSKPLKCAYPRVQSVEHVGDIKSGNLVGMHICKMWYDSSPQYYYYRMYYIDGTCADHCANNLNVMNKKEFIDRYIVIYTLDGEVSHTYGTKNEAEAYIRERSHPDRYYIQHAHYAK